MSASFTKPASALVAPPHSVSGATLNMTYGLRPVLDNLLIDTGSSNTWVGAGKAYVKTSTSVKTSDSVVVILSSNWYFCIDLWIRLSSLCHMDLGRSLACFSPRRSSLYAYLLSLRNGVLGHCDDFHWARYYEAIHRCCLKLQWLRWF
jgi:hypothetical protein